MRMARDEVRDRLAERGIQIAPQPVSSAIAALNTGKHLAVVCKTETAERALAFAEVLADSAAFARICIGWLYLHEATAALVRVDDLLTEPFQGDIWVVLGNASSAAISRTIDEIRERNHDATTARLLVVTSVESLREARLSAAAKRMLVPIAI